MSDERVIAAEQEASKISTLPTESPIEIPFLLYNRQENKTTRLVASSPEQSSMLGRNSWYNFELTEPVFITSVRIQISGYSSINEFQFSWRTADGLTKELAINPSSENMISADINALCKSFSFKPEKQLESKRLTKFSYLAFQSAKPRDI